jgi:hypothetical protein
MSIQRPAQIQALIDAGQQGFAFVHKPATPALPAAGFWADMSMSAGTPKFNAYVGGQLEFTPLIGNGNNGVYIGSNVTPAQKMLLTSMVQITNAAAVPMTLFAVDYVGFYPLVDMDSTDLQEFDNTATLPRFADGDGLKAFLVCTTPQTAIANGTLSYTDANDTVQSVSFTVGVSNVGTIQGGANGQTGGGAQVPFLALPNGIKNAQSIQMATGAGGFCALVICKPIFQTAIYQANTPLETTHFKDQSRAPFLADGAYINFLFSTSSSGTAGLFRAALEFVWG